MAVHSKCESRSSSKICSYSNSYSNSGGNSSESSADNCGRPMSRRAALHSLTREFLLCDERTILSLLFLFSFFPTSFLPFLSFLFLSLKWFLFNVSRRAMEYFFNPIKKWNVLSFLSVRLSLNYFMDLSIVA